MDTEITSEQLARYLAGESDLRERAAVERWAAADPANQRELDAFRTIWDLAEAPPATVDVDAAWSKVRARMDADAPRGRVVPLWRQGNMRWAAAAAAVLLIAGAVLLNRPQRQEWIAGASPVQAVLADSSVVRVEPGSELVASMGRKRRITLQGKAWFEVASDPERPFTVVSDGLEVSVLGTGFEVDAYDTARTWGVRVRHGRVRVRTGEADTVLLAGGRVVWNRDDGTLRPGVPVTAETWGDRIIEFRNAPMAEVIARLQERHHVRIELANPAMAACRLTAGFDAEPVQQVLQVVAGTFGWQLERLAPDHYRLSGDGC